MKLGFTGTQEGMTPYQLVKIALFLARNQPTESHSGDCVGADKDFLDLINLANLSPKFDKIITVGHIPSNNSKRAFGQYRIEMEPKPYLERNHNIVDQSDFIIATPKENNEQLRSGTWATIRYARKSNKKGMIVFPNGDTEDL